MKSFSSTTSQELRQQFAAVVNSGLKGLNIRSFFHMGNDTRFFILIYCSSIVIIKLVRYSILPNLVIMSVSCGLR